MTIVSRFKIYEYGTATQIAVGNVQTGGFYLGLSSGNKIRFRVNDVSSGSAVDITLTSDNKIDLDTWYTAVGTYDGNKLKLYINGILVDSVEYSNGVSVSTAPIVIGGNPNDSGVVTGSWFKGAISEAAVMKDVLSESEIAQNYGDIVHHVPTRHNVLYYLKFDADDGIVANSAQYENDGMFFDGLDDYISVGYSSYDFNNTFSIGAKLKLHSYSDKEYTIFGNPQNGGLNLFKSIDNKFKISVYDTNTNGYISLETDFVPELDTWYTVMATYDGTTLRLYVNGNQEEYLVTDIKMLSVTTPFMVGVNANLNSKLGGGYFNGIISDVILIDEALTEKQVSSYYSDSLKNNVINNTLVHYDLCGYEFRDDGTIIPDKIINAMWVWIPRFSAKLPINSSVIDVKFVGLDDEAHDSFTFSSNELAGFWVGKFENSANIFYKNADLDISVNSNILIKPNNISLVNKNIGMMFNQVNNIVPLSDVYGFDTLNYSVLDTHLVKNNEWAAVAYLAQSKYGLCRNGLCSELENNNDGYTGGTNYVSNILQSTTGNVYGIYDLNGGVDEFVMGNYNSTLNSLDGFNNLPDLKYLNVYTTVEDYSFENLQHALIETNELFNSSTPKFVSENNNWFIRNNLFSYNSVSGWGSTNIGSRTVLVVK